MRIRFEKIANTGGGGDFQAVAEDGREIVIEPDYDYCGWATHVLGWRACKCGTTDGTVPCKHKTVSQMIASAYTLIEKAAKRGKWYDDPDESYFGYPDPSVFGWWCQNLSSDILKALRTLNDNYGKGRLMFGTLDIVEYNRETYTAKGEIKRSIYSTPTILSSRMTKMRFRIYGPWLKGNKPKWSVKMYGHTVQVDSCLADPEEWRKTHEDDNSLLRLLAGW